MNDRLVYEIDSAGSPEKSSGKLTNFPDRNDVRLVRRCRYTLNAVSRVYVPLNELDASSWWIRRIRICKSRTALRMMGELVASVALAFHLMHPISNQFS